MLNSFFLIISLQSNQSDPSPNAVNVLEEIAGFFQEQIYSKVTRASRFYPYAMQIKGHMRSCIQSMKTQQLVNEFQTQNILRNLNSLLLSDNIQEEEKIFIRRTLYILGQWNFYINIVLTKSMSFNINSVTTEAEWQYNQGAKSVKNSLIGGIVGTILGIILSIILLPVVGVLALALLAKLPILSPILPFFSEHQTITMLIYLVSVFSGTYGITMLGAKFGEWLGNKFGPPKPIVRPFTGASYTLGSDTPSVTAEQKVEIQPAPKSKNRQQPMLPTSGAQTIRRLSAEKISLTSEASRIAEKSRADIQHIPMDNPEQSVVMSDDRYDLLYQTSLLRRTSMLPIQVVDTEVLARSIFGSGMGKE